MYIKWALRNANALNKRVTEMATLCFSRGYMNTNLIKEKLTPFIENLGYNLVEIKSTRRQGDNVLELVIDKVEPIDMDMISEVSKSVSDYLDEIDLIEESYVLDISSLGAEKPLKIEELDKYVGRFIHVHLINPIEGSNIFEGDLDACFIDSIKLSYKVKTRTKTVDIQKSNISKIRLAIKF